MKGLLRNLMTLRLIKRNIFLNFYLVDVHHKLTENLTHLPHQFCLVMALPLWFLDSAYLKDNTVVVSVIPIKTEAVTTFNRL